MFTCFHTLLGALDHYEKGQFGGLKVTFNHDDYEPRLGPNWWNYFFIPIDIKFKAKLKVHVLSPNEINEFTQKALKEMSCKRAHALIAKYVHVKQQILNEANQFSEKFFNHYHVIGVHYQALKEADRGSFKEMKAAIKKAIAAVPKHNKYRLFIATDAQSFLDYIKSEFSCPIAHTLHVSSNIASRQQYYKRGKEALIDCLLLARCHFLIRTESNLSLAAIKFNPSLPNCLIAPNSSEAKSELGFKIPQR
jgi:hypothetical protein